MRRSMDAMAREVGLVMEPKERLINTRLALATAEFARDRGAFESVHRALFKGHWEGTAELDRVADLRRIVAERGLDPDELEGALASGRYEPVIDRHRADASSMGINAIPSHIVGALPPRRRAAGLRVQAGARTHRFVRTLTDAREAGAYIWTVVVIQVLLIAAFGMSGVGKLVGGRTAAEGFRKMRYPHRAAPLARGLILAVTVVMARLLCA